jgi:hypothetical protein
MSELINCPLSKDFHLVMSSFQVTDAGENQTQDLKIIS